MSKTYLLMVDDMRAAQLSSLFTGLQFLEVQGVDSPGNEEKFKVLVSPITPSAPPEMVPIEPTSMEVVNESN